jgi:hypothetical protein
MVDISCTATLNLVQAIKCPVDSHLQKQPQYALPRVMAVPHHRAVDDNHPSKCQAKKEFVWMWACPLHVQAAVSQTRNKLPPTVQLRRVQEIERKQKPDPNLPQQQTKHACLSHPAWQLPGQPGSRWTFTTKAP